jgi:SAM-dependent methyltransferase
VILCDLSHGMLDATRELGFPRIRTDAAMLPFADRAFDAVIANHMLYHVEDRAAALAGIERVLKPGGKLYAATNSDAHLSSIRDLLQRLLGRRSPFPGAMPFRLENGEAQLRPHFDQIEIRRVGSELRVTDLQAVVGYVMSCNDSHELIAGGRLEELNRLVRERIAAEGAFVCHTATGMFVATTTA